MILRFIIAIAALLLALAPAEAKRIALVIGNNSYPNLPDFRQLQKAVNDARSMRDTLSHDLGFTVLFAENADWKKMNSLIKQLETSVVNGDIVFVYFSGHGVSIAGENYLLPSDIPQPMLGEEARLQGDSFGAESLTRRMQKRGARAVFAVLDACRNNPFEDEAGKAVGGLGGLTKIDAAEGVFTLFAAGLGQIALDRLSKDDPDPNSIFTRSLIPLLKTGGLSQVDLAKQVQQKVAALAATIGRNQKPAYYDQILGFVALKEGDAAVAVVPIVNAAAGEWPLVQNSNSKAVLEAFRDKYASDALYRGLAEEKLALLVPAKPAEPECSGVLTMVQGEKRCLKPGDAVGGACLITKNNTNPFFVKMKEGAEAKAKELGIELAASAGKVDGDAGPQIEAIENCVAAGHKGILITASNDSVIPALKAARAAGLLVIALDTPIGDAEAADTTFATDNFEAGLLIGEWAAATLGAEGVKKAKIGMLDINKDNISVDVVRDTGFLVGFGIAVPDLKVMGSETDARVIGHESSGANPEGGLKSAENLLAKNPDMNVIYTINEPAAEGAFQGMKAAGKEKQALIVSIDGSCPGVKSVADGIIGATSMQFPLLMASKGVEAVAAFAKDGTKPANSDGLNYFNTGVQLITDKPDEGVPSITSAEGAKICWG